MIKQYIFAVIILISSSIISATTTPLPKKNYVAKQRPSVDDSNIKIKPIENQQSKSFDPSKYKFQHPNSVQNKHSISTKPKPTPVQTRQMIEDAEIEAHNLKKLADDENERNLRQLMQRSIPVMPIQANSTIFFLGHRSAMHGQSMSNIIRDNDLIQEEFIDPLNSHFVSLFEKGIHCSGDDIDGADNSFNKVTVLHSSFVNQDYYQIFQAIQEGVLYFHHQSLSGQFELDNPRPVTVVLIIGAEVVTERQDTSNLWEYRPMVEKLLTALKRISHVKQVILTGLFLHGEHIASVEARDNHPYHSAFQEWSSMLQHLARDYDIAYVDLLTPYEQFQRKININNNPHSLLTTIDGQHLSTVGHAFFATQLLQAFHIKPPEALTSIINTFVQDHFAQESNKQLLEQTVSELLSKESSILQELSLQSPEFIADNWRRSFENNSLQSFGTKTENSFSEGANLFQSEELNAMDIKPDQHMSMGAFSLEASERTVDSGENIFEL